MRAWRDRPLTWFRPRKGETFGKELEVAPADYVVLTHEIEPLQKPFARAHQTEVAVLCEEGDFREMVEKLIEWRRRADALDEGRAHTICGGAGRRHAGTRCQTCLSLTTSRQSAMADL